MKITILLPYEYDSVPSQRFRWEQWEERFNDRGFIVTRIHFLSSLLAKLRDENRRFTFALGVIFRYPVWFLSSVVRALGSDVVIVHRNAALAGPPILELLISLLKKQVVYDFDDAIYLPPEGGDSFLRWLLRCDWRVGVNCRLAKMVGVGNQTLAGYAQSRATNIRVWPTSVDTVEYSRRPIPRQGDKLVVGWTGSSSTAQYIKPLLPTFAALQHKFDFELLIVGAYIDLDACGVVGECIPWTSETELDSLFKFDIGLMPLLDTPWASGKCALKALQYGALGIPAVVSNVGVNAEVVIHGVSGFLVGPDGDWSEPLCILLGDEVVREGMGNMGRLHVEQHYSADVIAPRVADDLVSLLLN